MRAALTMYVDDGLGDIRCEAGHRRHTPQPTAVVVDRQHESAAGAGPPLRPCYQHPQSGMPVHAELGQEPRRRGEVPLVDVEMQRRSGVATDRHAKHIPRLPVNEADTAGGRRWPARLGRLLIIHRWRVFDRQIHLPHRRYNVQQYNYIAFHKMWWMVSW